MPKRLSALTVALLGLAIVSVGAAILALTWVSGESFALYLAIYSAVALGFFGIYTLFGPLDVLSPAFGLPVLLFLYSAAGALYVESTGHLLTGERIGPSVVQTYYASCVLGLVGLATGILVSQVTPNPFLYTSDRAHNWFEDHRCYRKLLVYSPVLAIGLFPFVAASFNFLNPPAYAERAFALRVERLANPTSGVKALLLTELPVTLILWAATVLCFRSRRVVARLAGVCILTAYVLANIRGGWKGAVVFAVMIPIVFYHYRIRRISVAAAAIGLLLVYAFTSLLSLARVTSNPTEMLDTVKQQVADRGLNLLELKSSGELLTAANLMREISGLESGETKYTYGASVLSELAVFIPRAVFPDRPLPLSEKYVDVFYPGVRESGGGHGLFCLQEGYWAFGLLGVFLSMFIYGWFVQKTYMWFMRRMRHDIIALAYSGVFFALTWSSVRSGLIGSFKAALMNSLPFLLIVLLPAIASVKRPAGDALAADTR